MKLKRYLNEKIELTGEREKDKWLKEVEKWKTDLRKMTKIYKSLKSENTPQAVKQFKEAQKLFITFRQNWERWYTQFIKKKFVPGGDNTESIYSKEARVKGWQAETSIGSLFPDDYYEGKFIPRPDLLDYPRYDRGDTRKNKIIVYQKAFKKAFVAMEELIKYQFELVTPDKREQINIAGINLLITTDRDTDDWTKKKLKLFIDTLPKAVKAIKQAGFKDSLKGLTVKLRLVEKPGFGGDKGGEYISYEDTLALYAWGMVDQSSALHTLVHELGHRFFRKSLTKSAQEAWGKAIWKKFITVEKNHVEDFFNKYIKGKFEQKYDDPNEYSGIKKPERERLDALIKKNEKDPNIKTIYQFLVHTISYSTSLKELLNYVGERIHIEFITDYARKNTEEAFCEAFALYVNKRNQLGEWTRDFFKEVVRSGGANIKESKMDLIEKYLGEAKGASAYKKEFIKYAYEIIDNYMSQHPNKINFKDSAKQLQGAVVQIMGTMALPKGNPNYANMERYMPRKFNKELFDNGDGNSYDSEWLSMTDAKHFTIAREAMLQFDKKKAKTGLKRSDLSTF